LTSGSKLGGPSGVRQGGGVPGTSPGGVPSEGTFLLLRDFFVSPIVVVVVGSIVILDPDLTSTWFAGEEVRNLHEILFGGGPPQNLPFGICGGLGTAVHVQRGQQDLYLPSTSRFRPPSVVGLGTFVRLLGHETPPPPPPSLLRGTGHSPPLVPEGITMFPPCLLQRSARIGHSGPAAGAPRPDDVPDPSHCSPVPQDEDGTEHGNRTPDYGVGR